MLFEKPTVFLVKKMAKCGALSWGRSNSDAGGEVAGGSSRHLEGGEARAACFRDRAAMLSAATATRPAAAVAEVMRAEVVKEDQAGRAPPSL